MKLNGMFGAAAVWCLACGGSPPPPAEPTDPAPLSDPDSEPSPDQAQELSTTDEDDGAVGSDEEVAPLQGDDAVGSEADEKPLGNTVPETRTTEVIREVVNNNRQSVRNCFDALSKEEQGAGGTLTLSFKIDPKGKVFEAALNQERSTLKQPQLVTCAIQAVKKMSFPASSRGFESSVNYPFDFKP